MASLYSSLGRLANLISLKVGPCVVGMTMSIDQGDMPSTSMLLQRLELLPPGFIFSRLPRWIGRLKKLQILKISLGVLLSSDIDTLTELPALIVLSLYVQKCNIAESIIFNSGALPVLKYFDYRCDGALRLAFLEEALPNLERLQLCFDVHRVGSLYTSMLAGVEHLLRLKEITAEIGAPARSDGLDRMKAAETAFKEATLKHPRFPIHVNVKRADCDCIEEQSTPQGFMHRIPLAEEDQNKGKAAIDIDYNLWEDEQLARALQESLNAESPPRQNVPVENVPPRRNVPVEDVPHRWNVPVEDVPPRQYVPPKEPPPYVYPRSGLRICAGCHNPIGHGRFLSCMDSVWHPQRFRCFGCNKPISENEFAMHDDQPYHRSCFKEFFSPEM